MKTDPQPVNPPATPCELMEAEVRKYTDWDWNIVQAIAQAENRACDPLRHNETASETHKDRLGNVICVGSYGVIQVGCLHYAPTDDRNDLATNIRLAHKVYQERKSWDTSGYNAWTMYKNGEYKRFLK